nr:TlyA family RNA methyltransferase [Maliibacterium massiliense]
MTKQRLDTRMVALGLAESRQKAQAILMTGAVCVNGQPCTKPAAQVGDADQITVTEHLRYVSRGGLKLERALEVFPIDLAGRVALDIGASTGGFTDCMLQNGAAHVYAVDVGYGQLDWKLRSDARVSVLERTNARYITPDLFEGPPTFGSIDASFISLKLLLPPLRDCLGEAGEIVALIKPQFEAGRAQVGKKGVVRDAAVHQQVIEEMLAFARGPLGMHVMGLDHSPITGPQGNIEFLLYLQKTLAQGAAAPDIDARAVVARAHDAHHKTPKTTRQD